MSKLNFSPKTDLASLLLRIAIGGIFFLHGIGKPMLVGMDVVIKGFAEQGYPFWTAYASTIIEIGAGLMLIIGLHSRWASLFLLPNTIGILIYHFPNGWVFHNPGGGWEYPQLLLAGLLVLWCLGDGRFSLMAKLPKTSQNA